MMQRILTITISLGVLLVLGLSLSHSNYFHTLIRQPTPALVLEKPGVTSSAAKAAPATNTQVTVDGFTFDYPLDISDIVTGPLYLIGWFPGQSDEVAVMSFNRSQLLTVNLQASQAYALSDISNMPINPFMVHLLTQTRVAYTFPIDSKAHSAARVVNRHNTIEGVSPLSSTTYLYPVSLPGEGDALFFDKQTGQMADQLGMSNQVKGQQIDTLLAALKTLIGSDAQAASPQPTTAKGFYAAAAPQGAWLALYTLEQLRLVNLGSGENREISLRGICQDCEPHPYLVRWSPDGQQLAILVANHASTFSDTELMIYAVKTGALQKMSKVQPGRYVRSFAWAPDSVHLVCMVLAKAENGSAFNELALANTQTHQMAAIDFPGLQMLGGNVGWSISWSPDGQTIVLTFWDGVSDLNRQFYLMHVSTYGEVI